MTDWKDETDDAEPDDLTEEPTSAFIWCLHCSRTFHKHRRPVSGYRGRTNTSRCFYRDCDGGYGDLWDWAQIRDVGGFPEAPRPHVVYEQFGGRAIEPREADYPYAYGGRS